MPLTGEYAPSEFDFARDQVELYERSGGAEGNKNPSGQLVIVLTSVGAKTGKLRKSPLMRVEHDGEYAVVASLGGAPKHPVWYYNLTANPHVELQDGPVKKDYQAREVHGEEYATWFERAVAAYPDYAEYQKKTTRTMPIFVLTPLNAGELRPYCPRAPRGGPVGRAADVGWPGRRRCGRPSGTGLVMANLQVVAVMTAKPGSVKLVGEALLALVEPARSEPGCNSYQLFTSAVDPATFITVETWSSQEELNAHYQSPQVQQALSAVSDDLVQAPAIHPLIPVNTV